MFLDKGLARLDFQYLIILQIKQKIILLKIVEFSNRNLFE